MASGVGWGVDGPGASGFAVWARLAGGNSSMLGGSWPARPVTLAYALLARSASSCLREGGYSSGIGADNRVNCVDMEGAF